MTRTTCLVGLFAAALLASPATASQELREKIAELAKDVRKNTNEQPVRVGKFTETGLPDSNAGLGFETLLTDELERLQKGIVQEKARFEVKGDYGLVKSKANAALREVRLTVRVIDTDSGEELKEIRKEAAFDGTATLAKLLQVTAALPPDGSKKERIEELQKQVKKPAAFIHGAGKTLVSSSKDSPFAVEVLAGSGVGREKPLPATIDREGKKGLAFVDIPRDQIYLVRVYSNADHDTAVSLTVDGIDVFHFSEDRDDTGRPRFTHFIVPSKNKVKEPTTIAGWHKTVARDVKDNFLSFKVTKYGEGVASKIGAPRGGVGVIHVQFARCRELRPGVNPKGGNETGFGPPREVKQEVVRVEIDPPHDFVSIRYTR